MPRPITIPLLPCRSIDDVLEFYRALGFEVTYQQAKPNNYAVVEHDGIELHFFSMSAFVPADSYGSCYVRVPEVDEVYQAFTTRLRAKFGRVPSAGIPRIIALKNKTGRREFIIVDPGGNWIRIGQPLEGTDGAEAGAQRAGMTPLARALNAASLLADSKGDYPAAAKLLDPVLALAQTAPATDRLPALVFRAGLAVTMGDRALAEALLTEARQVPLAEADRAALADDLQRAADLEHMLATT